ncbi:InlB B-repeat-containing protein [Marinobacter sp.]|uniref:InlB B-repeat-containing protein n=1 Tax=Marinobacter sp. TaxID=50741 RepID=UPI0035656923
MVLRQGAETLSSTSNGAFSFPTPLADGSSYGVVIDEQPSNQVCDVTNGSGSISSSDVTNVSVSCVTSDFSIGGTVTGLEGSGLVLQNDGGDDLSIAANGSFTFATALADGSGYDVTVLTQPGSPSQTCNISNSSGTLAGANITDVTVNCITDTFTLSFDSAGGTQVDDITQDSGTAITEPSNPTREGYSFLDWDPELPATMPAGDLDLTAQWTANTYSIAYDANEGTGTTADSSHTYDTASALTSNGFTREGYSFAGWNTAADGSGTSYADGESVTDLSATNGATVTLYAQWTGNTYSIAYDANEGTGTTTDSSHTYDTASALTNNGFNREGYSFAGWNTAADGTGTSYADGASVTDLSATDGATVTLYAQWTANEYALTFDSDGGTEVADITQDFGTAITAPTDPTREGFTFAGWDPVVPATMPVNGLALTAQWDEVALNITATALEGGSVSPESASVGLGDTAEFQFTVDGGYLFDQASGCGLAVSGQTLTTAEITEDCSIQVSFERVASAGSGTEEDPFIITDGADLPNLDRYKTSFFVLDGGEDSTLEVGSGWQPIGSDEDPFTGSVTSIDGNPVILTGLGGQPVFDQIGPGARVSNLIIQGSQNPSAGDNAGLLANSIRGTEENPANVSNITIDATSSISGSGAVGGLAGTVEYANLTGITIEGDVNGGDQVGGVAGTLERSTARDILVNGDVTGSGVQIGGIAGRIDDAGISDGAVNGNVAGGGEVGGIGGNVSASDLRNLAFNGGVTGGSSDDDLVGVVDQSSDIQQVAKDTGESPAQPFSWQLLSANGDPLENDILATDDDILIAIEGGVLPLAINGTVQRGNATEDLAQEIRQGVVLKDADGDRNVLTLRDNRYVFRAQRGGLYELNFEDSDGQAFTAELDIRAQVAFTSTRQPAATGEEVTVRAALQGIPAQFPVTVPYQVENHNLLGSSDLDATGSFRFEAGGEQESIVSLRLTPAATVGDVTIALQQGQGADDALLGNPAEHRLVLRQPAELPLPVRLGIEQGVDDLSDLPVASRNEGVVTVTAISPANGVAFDPASHSFDWSQSSLVLGVQNETGASVQIDPARMTTEDLGTVRVLVTETAGAQRQVTAATRLRFVGDDDLEAIVAFDGFLTDGQDSRNRRPICPEGSGNFRDQPDRNCSETDRTEGAVYLEAPIGYRLALGQMSERASWETGDFGLEISDDEIRDEGADVAVRNARDTLFRHLGYLVDFEVSGLDFAGQSVPVVIPLPRGEAIPADAVWRKYIRQNWETFAEDDANQLFSASSAGDCPWPGSDRWTAGLTEGDNCVRLVIQDGGPNDLDGVADGVIRDPGTLAVNNGSDGQKLVSNGGGGGLSSMGGMLLVLAALSLFRRRRLLLVLALLAAGSAQAQTGGNWSLGAQLGQASTDISSADINDRLNKAGVTGQASVTDNDRLAGRIFIGYQWNRYLGFEGGLVDLGEITMRLSGTDPGLSAADLDDVRPGTGRGLEFSAVGRYPLTEELDVTGRLGMLRWRTSLNFEGGGSDLNMGNDAVFGLGLEYRLHESWSARVSIDRYRVEHDDTDLAAVGISYHFGGR